jgi:hypothetical protein
MDSAVTRRVLVTGAGTGISNNLIRSLTAGDPSLFIVGCHADRFVLKKSLAKRNHLVPAFDHPGFADRLCHLIDAERIDLLVPDHDPAVRAIAALRDRIPCRLFLPRTDTIELCEDKYALTVLLRTHGIPAPLTYEVTDRASVEEIFRKLARSSRLWCRIRNGSGSRGATPVKSPEQAWAWISYWQDMRRVPARDFTLSEFLPGRDFNVQGLWQEGTPVLLKMCERLSYFEGANRPSGMSSTPALAKTVLEPRALQSCIEAIRQLDPAASGVFNFDLKEDPSGVACLTEINAGRFAMITNIYDFTGVHNMAATYVRLAFGERVKIRELYDIAQDYYLVRDLDTEPGIFPVDQLFQDFEHAGGRAGIAR